MAFDPRTGRLPFRDLDAGAQALADGTEPSHDARIRPLRPKVQVAGASIAPRPTIAISCSRSRRSISLSNFSPGPLRNVASYEVREDIARMAREQNADRV